MVTEMEETKTEEPQFPKYFIDIDWHLGQRRSFKALLRSRILLLGGEKVVAGIMKKDDRKILSAVAKVKFNDDEFIPPDLPIMEAVFRLFMTVGNRPMTPVEIRDLLMEWWREVGPYRDLEPQSLNRMIDNDEFYGFRQAPV